jgi:hypothetical protein
MHITEIIREVDRDTPFLGHVSDPPVFYELIHPRDINGINKRELLAWNLEGIEPHWNPKCDCDEVEFRGDDQHIIFYLEDAISQRDFVGQTVPSYWLFDAVLYLQEHYATRAVVNFFREDLSVGELFECLTRFKEAIDRVQNLKIKGILVERMFYFFCYMWLAPELPKFPNIAVMIEDPSVLEILQSYEQYV